MLGKIAGNVYPVGIGVTSLVPVTVDITTLDVDGD